MLLIYSLGYSGIGRVSYRGLLYTVASKPPGGKPNVETMTYSKTAILFIHIGIEEPAAGQTCELRGVWQREPSWHFSCAWLPDAPRAKGGVQRSQVSECE